MLKKLTLLFLIFSFHFLSQAQYGSDPSIAKYQLQIEPLHQQVTLGLLGETPAVTYESLKQQNIQNFSDFLDELQLQAPVLFNQAVLIHSSGSLQPSNRQNLRVILYGENLSVSFSTNPLLDPRVEILQFHKDTLDFSMHEIVFDNKGAQYNDNPRECKVCHGQNPKPVWEAYDFWPSAIGSQSGTTHSDDEKALLDWVQNTQHTDPVLSRINTKNLKESIDAFTSYLSLQNFLATGQKIKKDLQQGGKLYPFRYALLGIMSCTDKSYNAVIDPNIIYKDYLPEAVTQQWSTPFDAIFDDVVVSNKRVKDDLWNYYIRVFSFATYPTYPGLERLRVNEIVQASQLGYIFANLGLNLRDFTLSPRQDSYILSTPTLFDFDLQKNYLYFVPELIKELNPSVQDLGGADLQYFKFDCEELKKKSVAELQNWQAQQKFSLMKASRPHAGMAPYGMCVTCHSREALPNESKPPYIPFENTWKLGRELRNTDLFDRIRDRLRRDDIKQMPKDLPHLEPDEIQSFMSTLRKIELQSR